MAYLGRRGALAPVTSADIPDNSITTAKLIDSSVTSAKIGVDVIVAEDIANNAITVAELADNAVTQAKLADDAVGTAELANDIAINTSGAITTTGQIFSGAAIHSDWRQSGLTVSQGDGYVNLMRASANLYSPYIEFSKSRGTLTSPTIVENNDNCGALQAYGWDGSTESGDGNTPVGAIQFSVDGTPGANDMPGRITFHTTADGAAVVTERMRIDSSGNVGIGVVPESDWYNGYHMIQMAEGAVVGGYSDNSVYLASNWKDDAGNKYMNTDEASRYKQSAGVHYFDVAPSGTADAAISWTTGMTIANDGKVGIGVSPANALDVLRSVNGDYAAKIVNSATSTPYGLNIQHGGSTNGTSNAFVRIADASATRFQIVSNGNVQNVNNSYGATSDERIKQDIVSASSQWNDIKAIRVVNFKRKSDVAQDGENAPDYIGVIAQEVELVSPKLVCEISPDSFELEHCGFGEQNEDGEWIVKKDSDDNDMTVKSMSYSILQMKAFKALQEAMAKIETLETKVTALESA